MRSLDSVIEAIDNCLVDPCPECPVYVNDKCRKDSYAAYYLKEYREMLNNVENEPLEWEELLKMVGKPVWIEQIAVHKKNAGWTVIRIHDVDYIVTTDRLFSRETFGKTWQAFKKERK